MRSPSPLNKTKVRLEIQRLLNKASNASRKGNFKKARQHSYYAWQLNQHLKSEL
jgi:hypothetical protein